MKHRPKISIIGAGFVGSTTALYIASRGIGDVVLLDRTADIAKGKALDILQAMPIVRSDVKIIGTSSYKDTRNSDVVVITAGVPRKPGMSRDDLLKINADIIKNICKQIVQHAKEAVLMVVTNPLDAMVHLAWKETQFPHHKVIGMAGVLDCARMRTFIAEKLRLSPSDVSTMALGGHGDTMVPLMRFAHVNGVPVINLLSEKQIDEIIERTRNGGAEIVNYLKTGSAYFAPAAAIMEMVDSIVHDKKKVLPCAAYLNGEYGVKGLFIGVPVVLGADGIEKVIEIPLNVPEKKAFNTTVKHVRKLVDSL